MKRKNILKFISLLGIGSIVTLAVASCRKAVTSNPGNPSNPNTDNPQNPNIGNSGDDAVDPALAAKTEAKTAIDASAELSDSVKEALKRQVEATATEAAARDLKTKAEALVSTVKALSELITAAKAVKEDAQYNSVDATLKTTLEEKYTAAAGFLTEDSKLKNLDAWSNLDTTKASLESAKTDLDTAVNALMPEFTFAKTKASAVKTASELGPLVNPALKAELQRQVDALTKDHATEATTMLANLISLKESLESLQTLVSDGLKMQMDYPQKYYDADNKSAFDDALLKASSVFPAFQWTAKSIMVPAPEGDVLPNPRAWTKARDKSEFKLQNFVMAPAQATTPTITQTSPSATASAIVRVATGTEETSTMQTAPAEQTPTADLASTVSYLKSLNDTLKAATDALNGDNPITKTAYYKADPDRTLYWDGFMPKIVLTDFDPHWTNQKNIDDNKSKLQTWFNTKANWNNLEDQLVKKLGSEKFKNVLLSKPNVTLLETFEWNGKIWGIPTVTFKLAAKEGYKKATDFTDTIALQIRVVYNSINANEILFPIQGASYSAAPGGARNANDEITKRTVNVYLNYTGPNIELDAELPKVGSKENSSINGTSNVDDDFNNKFKKLLVSVVGRTTQTSLLFQAVMNYVNKFDPKYPAMPTSDQKNGVTWAKVENNALKIAYLNDPNAVFVQQMKDDTKAVYFAVNGVANNGWLNTFLIRIPLTKFVRPLTEFRPVVPSTPASPENSEEETQQDSQENNEAEQRTTGQTENNSTEEATEDSGSGSSNADSSQNSGQQSQQSPQS
ncbi:FIVAR domain-containing protein [Mycoplasmoides gallisepticum]|uniref:FIVAR domain-containing protein n=1 Tax=Mycoplasmoides gallisepticum TaxID=2096 RepID=UPI00370373B1